MKKRFLELFGVKIRQYFLARDERRHVCLIGELEHRPVGFAILALLAFLQWRRREKPQTPPMPWMHQPPPQGPPPPPPPPF